MTPPHVVPHVPTMSDKQKHVCSKEKITRPEEADVLNLHHLMTSSSFVCVCPQDFHSLATYLSQCSSTTFLEVVSDFHLLLFLVTNEVMPLRVSGASLSFVIGTKALDSSTFLRGLELFTAVTAL